MQNPSIWRTKKAHNNKTRRFQQAQNHKNPITGCGEIDR